MKLESCFKLLNNSKVSNEELRINLSTSSLLVFLSLVNQVGSICCSSLMSWFVYLQVLCFLVLDVLRFEVHGGGKLGNDGDRQSVIF